MKASPLKEEKNGVLLCGSVPKARYTFIPRTSSAGFADIPTTPLPPEGSTTKYLKPNTPLTTVVHEKHNLIFKKLDSRATVRW